MVVGIVGGPYLSLDECEPYTIILYIRTTRARANFIKRPKGCALCFHIAQVNLKI